MSSRFKSYVHTAITLLHNYTGAIPFHYYLKQYFAQHKKHGSKDRKLITHLCYCYLRLGNLLDDVAAEDRIKIALFVCADAAGEWQVLYEKNWLNAWSNNLFERIDFIKTLYPLFAPENIFSFSDQLSEGIDAEAFALSHLIQPDLFLRVRPGKKKLVTGKLNAAGILFEEITENRFALVNTTKANIVLQLDNEVVVQDFSSQRIAEFLQVVKAAIVPPTSNNAHKTPHLKIWDCCAASGGKAILAYDFFDDVELSVSDVRPSIIHNLKERFKEAGILKYKSFVADLAGNFNASTNKYDLVICDVPCSGSGTWSRTPEQLCYFDKNKIEHYAQLQKQIISNTIPHVNAQRFFLYITCSVFKKENEEAVAFIKNNFPFKLIKMDLLKGYDKKADTMFAALFTAV